ncbi:hypothetical protein BUALT_Bualt15G0076900 [Buddleja alternifolia]|uniref:WAT1-related protein n=1 Tax=Buddleja alternifolia TaxID=168488 RepID=A0AAV6WIR6_9LAMI|nr:hypothetical protein BUALT_Bualt15G0076900 [Buddleja alternifolia]
MIMVQSVYALVNVGYKLAANDGMSLTVLVSYRFMFGAAFIIPIAFFAERKKRPKLTWTIVFYGFFCGLFGGSLGQNLYLKSLVLTSATFTSAMTNLIPAITFIIAISLRLERLGWSSAAGKAKVFGSIVGIGEQCFLHFTKAKVTEKNPCPYSITAMMTLSASIQGLTFALCTERDRSKWVMVWDIRLLTVAVAGILGSGLMFTFVAWCVRMRGPLFVSIFQPLLLVMVAIAGLLFLEEKLHLGLVLGAILIVGGLYVVLWGKGKELKKVSQLMPENVEDEVQIDMPPPLPPRNGSSHGSSNKKEAEEEEKEEKRDSQASSEVLACILKGN